jgi:hypothetical protein
MAEPTVKGILAFSGILWAKLANSTTDGFLVSLGIVGVLYLLDGVLGTWSALQNGEFKKRQFAGFISKALAYSAVGICAIIVGTLTELAIGAELTLGIAFTLATGANVALAGTEGISVLGHVDRLTDGALADLLGWLRPMLTQMRTWQPKREPPPPPETHPGDPQVAMPVHGPAPTAVVVTGHVTLDNAEGGPV